MDRQKRLVYAWEGRMVAPHDKTPVAFHNITSIVNYVWAGEGLNHPPLVGELPKQAKKTAGDATRLKVRFPETTNTWIILHELSHSMTSLHDGNSNHHGALFMGIYCQLLAKYLKLDFELLVSSAIADGLRVERDARPVF